MLQERIPGGDDELYTVGSYLDAARARWPCSPAASCASTRTPAAAAASGESVWVPELADAGLRLLQELRFHGVSQVEFKRDPRDGRYCLMEVNARHWKWHWLAAACGVNLSLAAYRDAIGEPYVAPRQADGVKWIVAIKDMPLTLLPRSAAASCTPVAGARSLRGTRVDGLYCPRRPGARPPSTRPRRSRRSSPRQPRARAEM